MKSRIQAWLTIGVAAAVVATSAQAAKDEDRGRVLAEVNGTKLYENDLISATVKDQMPEDAYGEHVKRVVETAVNQELMYQAAVKAGLDKNEDYIAAVEQAKKMEAQRKFEVLASWYEQQVEALTAARDRTSITEEDVDKYYAENEARYKGRSADRAKRIIRSQLANARYRDTYSAWLVDEVAEAKVKVNGKKLNAKLLQEGVTRVFGGEPAEPPDPLTTELFKLGGVKLPEAGAVLDEEATKELREKAAAVTIKTGDTEFTLGDLYQFDGLFQSVVAGVVGPDVVYILKTYILADAALAAKMDQDPKFVEQSAAMGGMDVTGIGGGANLEKDLLVNQLITDQGFYDMDSIEVKDEEVDAYYAENKERYARLESRPGGKDRVMQMMKRIVRSQKAESTKQAYIEELRKAAKVAVSID